MNIKFSTFIEPLLNSIDSGVFFKKFFGLLYSFSGILAILSPLYLLYTIISYRIFSLNAKIIISVMIIWLIYTFVAWICFQIWWNRKKQLKNLYPYKSQVVVVPLFSHFIKTTGEVFGFSFGILGCMISLLAVLILGSSGNYLLSSIPIFNLFNTGLMSIILYPFFGFIIIVLFRVIGELIESISLIANNTSK